MKTYRKNVGIVVYDAEQGSVLLFERADHPGSWQFPQGGIDPGEVELEAAYRELHEETGIKRSEVLRETAYPGWLRYDFPDHVAARSDYAGQRQKWYFFSVNPAHLTIDLHTSNHDEFQGYKWTSFEASIETVVDFKRSTYEALAIYFAHLRAS